MAFNLQCSYVDCFLMAILVLCNYMYEDYKARPSKSFLPFNGTMKCIILIKVTYSIYVVPFNSNSKLLFGVQKILHKNMIQGS